MQPIFRVAAHKARLGLLPRPAAPAAFSSLLVAAASGRDISLCAAPRRAGREKYHASFPAASGLCWGPRIKVLFRSLSA